MNRDKWSWLICGFLFIIFIFGHIIAVKCELQNKTDKFGAKEINEIIKTKMD